MPKVVDVTKLATKLKEDRNAVILNLAARDIAVQHGQVDAEQVARVYGRAPYGVAAKSL